jgi:arabinose-5-phosphate isomerase
MNYLETGKQTIMIEYEALKRLHSSLDKRFIHSVKRIKACEGRIVVTGVGKSALVGQKIVATLNSTGTHAMFMHGADAVHGDLGMIGEKDLVICISKSGETSELKLLIPVLQQAGTEIIGMTSNETSYIAKQADDILYTPVKQEADPNNLAPTSSSTVQLAMGDAVAMALCGERGFQAKDFAKFHPGGALGKKLYTRVKDLIQAEHFPVVKLDAAMRDILLEMSRCRMGATAVCEEDELRGVITDGDIRRWYEGGGNSNASAKEIMNAGPKTVSSEEMAITAYEEMRKSSINQLLVLEKGKYIGMIHLHDLLREGIV